MSLIIISDFKVKINYIYKKIQMKNITYLLILFSFNSLFSQNSVSIKGEWNATDFWKNNSKFIFSEDGYISMTINGQLVDGKNFIIRGGKNDGEKAEMKYDINYTKSPIELDIVALKTENGKQKEYGRMFCILKFINSNEAYIIISKGARDSDFNDENKERIVKLLRQN